MIGNRITKPSSINKTLTSLKIFYIVKYSIDALKKWNQSYGSSIWVTLALFHNWSSSSSILCLTNTDWSKYKSFFVFAFVNELERHHSFKFLNKFWNFEKSLTEKLKWKFYRTKILLYYKRAYMCQDRLWIQMGFWHLSYSNKRCLLNFLPRQTFSF